MTAWHTAMYERALSAAKRKLGEADFETVFAEGAMLRWEDTLDAALNLVENVEATTRLPSQVSPPNRRGRPRLPGLSARELEVLRQITAGHTNQQIATALYMSPKTVMHHSSHIYQKLGVRGRAEAVAYASRHDLLQPA